MREAGLTALVLLAVVGFMVIVAQVRYEWRKRKAFKDVDRVIRQKGIR